MHEKESLNPNIKAYFEKKSFIASIWLIVLCFHTTDIKFFDIKLTEILMLLILPVLIFTTKKINKFTLLYTALFIFYFISSFIINLTQDFYLDFSLYGVFKQPFYISIARFIELISCLTFMLFIESTFDKMKKYGYDFNGFLHIFLKINIAISIIYIFLWVLTIFKIFPNDIISYQIYTSILRMKGLYAEGGPLGVMYAVLFALTYFTRKPSTFFRLIFLVIILLAQSKAGLLLVATWIFIMFGYRFKDTIFNKLIISTIAVIVLAIGTMTISSKYLKIIQNIKYDALAHSADPNYTMGRVPAITYIIPNIVQDRPLMGVGLGNYSLVRNNPIYREIFLYKEEWDLSGLGGLINLIAETGFIGFSLFISICIMQYYASNKTKIQASQLIILFLLPMIFGVQMTFLYIWGIIAFSNCCKHPPNN